MQPRAAAATHITYREKFLLLEIGSRSHSYLGTRTRLETGGLVCQREISADTATGRATRATRWVMARLLSSSSETNRAQSLASKPAGGPLPLLPLGARSRVEAVDYSGHASIQVV